MKKLKLDFEFEIDFFLLGLSCHIPDYRLAWLLNKTLDIDLERKEDIDLKLNRKNDEGFFSYFQHDDQESFTTINLISNRCEKGYFANEVKQLDFFLQLWLPNSEEDELISLKKKIKTCPQIITCVNLNPEELKSKNNFLF